MIRILNAEPKDYSDEARRILRDLGEVVESSVTHSELLAELPSYDVLIVRLAHEIDREVLDAGRRLRVVTTATTGLDHIDTEYAREKGIVVLSLAGETEFLRSIAATAEHTWALLLALLRRVPAAVDSVRAGGWDRGAYRGRELDGKRLGILGLGRVGQMVARYGLAFNMRVATYDPYIRGVPEGVGEADSLVKLLHGSDVLSLHVPLDSRTRGMIGTAELTALPAGAVLLNTSRGELVDEEALVDALERGHLAGAALDVVCHERSPEKRQAQCLLSYARSHDNLLLTPHIAGATAESMAKTEVFMARKLAGYVEQNRWTRGDALGSDR